MRQALTALALILLLSVPDRVAGQMVQCDLGIDTYGLQGTCTIDRDIPRKEGGSRQLFVYMWPDEPVQVVLATGPSDPPPWRGAFLLPDQPLAFEIVREREGTPEERLVLRSAAAWLVVREWSETLPARIAGYGRAELGFDIAEYPHAGPDDVAILEDAEALIDSLVTWDREDDRNCSNDPPGTMGFFCLLAHAVERRMGAYHHRQPALELIRIVVRENWPDRMSGHALMDFNNHPSTTLDDLRSAIRMALERASAENASGG